MLTIYYIGDSTVARNNIHSYPQTGMSQGFLLYLKESVRLESHAKNGRSTKSFLDEGRFQPIEAAMRPGDILLIQFGHNDNKDDPARHTDPQTSFKDNLRLYISAARRKGAFPVLITPISRRYFDQQGKFLPGSHGPYPAAMREVAAEEGVPLVDLTAVTERFLTEIGDEASKPLFIWPKDNTHLKPEGAVKMAGFLAEGLRALGGVYASVLAGQDEGADK